MSLDDACQARPESTCGDVVIDPFGLLASRGVGQSRAFRIDHELPERQGHVHGHGGIAHQDPVDDVRAVDVLRQDRADKDTEIGAARLDVLGELVDPFRFEALGLLALPQDGSAVEPVVSHGVHDIAAAPASRNYLDLIGREATAQFVGKYMLVGDAVLLRPRTCRRFAVNGLHLLAEGPVAFLKSADTGKVLLFGAVGFDPDPLISTLLGLRAFLGGDGVPHPVLLDFQSIAFVLQLAPVLAQLAFSPPRFPEFTLRRRRFIADLAERVFIPRQLGT